MSPVFSNIYSNIKTVDEARRAFQQLLRELNNHQALILGNPHSVSVTDAMIVEDTLGGVADDAKKADLLVSGEDGNMARVEGSNVIDDLVLTGDASESSGVKWAAVMAKAFENFFNGTIRESFDALITSNGTVVTLTVTNAVSGDLTLQFSDGKTTFTGGTTLDSSGTLTLGADFSSPVLNYVYILQSTKVLAASTTGWPTAEHAKICLVDLPDATTVQAQGAYINQNINDHLMDTNSLGHLAHIALRLRRLGAIYIDGIGQTMTIGGGATVDLALATGTVSQMHDHTFPAFDTASGGEVLVVNHATNAFTAVTDLETVTADAVGGTFTNRYFNWVFWAVANKTGEYAPVMLNLPLGSYVTQAQAEADADNYTVTSIPARYRLESTTGFLVVKYLMRVSGAGAWSMISETDLRGKTPDTAGGGSGSGMNDLIDDVTPQLGGTLDLNNNILNNSGTGNFVYQFGNDTSDLFAIIDNLSEVQFQVSASGVVTGEVVLDEDAMSSDSATKLATQQSIKAYVDASAGGPVTGEVPPFSGYIIDSAGILGDGFHDNGNGGASGVGRIHGLQLAASPGSNAAIELVFKLPLTLPSGTLKLLTTGMAAPTSAQNVQYAILWNSCDAGVSTGGLTVYSEGTDTVSFGSTDDHKFLETLTTLDHASATTPSAGDYVLVRFLYSSASTLDVVSTWNFWLVWTA